MKNYSVNQIKSALIKGIKESDIEERLNDISRAPFYNSALKLRFYLTFSDEDTWDVTVPIHIKIERYLNEEIIKECIIREIAFQVFRIKVFDYYNYVPLKITVESMDIISAYSWEEGKFAIFHIEQECGVNWLEIHEKDCDAPTTYRKSLSGKGVKRNETSHVTIYRRGRRR